MITQELVAFIKQQLQEGKSKEQIANILTPHGWELVDINAVFAQLLPTAAPVAPQQAPVVQSPTMQPYAAQQVTQSGQYAATSVTAQSVTPGMQSGMQGTAQPVVQSVTINTAQQAAPTGATTGSGFMYSFKNPTAVFAGIALVLSTIASTLLVYYTNLNQLSGGMMAQSQMPSTIDQNSMIGGVLASLMIGIIISGLITKLITKILSIVPRTFAQAFTFSSVALLATAIFSTLTILGVHAAVPALIGIIFWVVFFWYYYSTGVGKAIGAFFLNLLAGIILAALLFAAALGLGIGMVATLMNGLRGVNTLQTAGQVIQTTNDMQSLPIIIPTDSGMSDASSTALSPEDALNAIIAGNSTATASDTATTGANGSASAAITNPEFAHVKDALPVGFPLPKDEQVITAAVLSANTYEGIRYILEYTSTNSLAYLRNNMKSALEKAGYTYSINEKDLNHRVITATQVVRDSVRSFRIELKQVGTTDATVKVVFSQ